MKRMLERMNHVLQAVAVLAVLSLTSCEHKDLCHDSLHVVNVKVVFDWRNAPGATPETMRLYLFPVRGGQTPGIRVYRLPGRLHQRACRSLQGPVRQLRHGVRALPGY